MIGGWKIPELEMVFILLAIAAVLIMLVRLRISRHKHVLFPRRVIIEQYQFTDGFHGGQHFMAITGVKQGATGTFQIVSTDTNVPAFPTGTTFKWSVDDTANVSITPGTTDPSQVAAAVSANDPNASFTLTCLATSADGTKSVTATGQVPVLAAAVPFPSSAGVTQLS